MADRKRPASIGPGGQPDSRSTETPRRPGEGTVTSRLDRRRMVGPATRREPSLVVVKGYALGAIYRIGNEEVTLGRDLTNAIAIDDVGVSRFHASLERLGERATMRDLGSKNGTFVNGEEVSERLLSDGDLIDVGLTTYKFLAGDNVEHSFYEGMHTVAMHDPLTELPNRRYLDDMLARETARAERHAHGLWLLLADLDRFKAVNDAHGHLAGDMVLRETGRLIRARLRSSEFAARYGGEEFAFVLTDTTHDGCMVFAEALRRLIDEHPYRIGGHELAVTISIGGVSFGGPISTVDALVDEADDRLYAAKRAGRNRVVLG